jgi:hypothetical protein
MPANSRWDLIWGLKRLKNIKAGQSRVGLATSYNRQAYHEADRFWSSQFPDDEYRYGPKYIGLFNIPSSDMAASLRTFC